MASRNTQLEQAPRSNPIIDPKGNVSEQWMKWFNRIKFYLSNDNHQVISNANSDINLDAGHIALEADTASGVLVLNAPTIEDKMMTIQMTSRTNPFNMTIALTNVIGGSASTTATFDAVNETLILRSIKDKWAVIREIGVTLT